MGGVPSGVLQVAHFTHHPDPIATELNHDAAVVPPAQLAVRHCLGVLLIVLVACIWVGASQLIEGIFQDLTYDKPYFITYFDTCGFALWLLGALCTKRWRRQLGQPLAIRRQSAEAPAIRRGVWVYAGIALSVAPAWMLANYLFNLSLDATSVASNSVLSTTSSLWTLLFSACLFGERVDPMKLLSVAATVTGAALVATADSGSGHGGASQGGSGNVWGDLLALVSACTYGAYTALLKLCVPDDAEVSVVVAFGFVGLLVLTCGWPVMVLLDVCKRETFEWPPADVLPYLAINALVGTNLSDVLWARALQLTSPLVATLGLSLTIPIGMLSDALLRGKRFGARYAGGAGLVFAGFVLGSVAEHLWDRIRAVLERGGGVGGRRDAAHCAPEAEFVS